MPKSKDIRAKFLERRDALNALIVEKAQRQIEDPDRYLHPEERDIQLTWLIFATRSEVIMLEAQCLSAEGVYVFIGCMTGEHKKCNREVMRAGARLVCGCSCHSAQSEGKEEPKN